MWTDGSVIEDEPASQSITDKLECVTQQLFLTLKTTAGANTNNRTHRASSKATGLFLTK